MAIKKYEFTTDRGTNVTLTTKTDSSFYFGIYATCDLIGVKDQWCHLDIENTIHVCNLDDGKHYAFHVPSDIASQINTNRKEAITNTGKIIIATITRKDGSKVRELYGMAYADPILKSMVNFVMPQNMFLRVQHYAKDGIIYDNGGIEDACESCDKLFCNESSPAHYWMYKNQSDDNELFECFGIKHDQGEENAIYDLELRVVTPLRD